MNKQNRDYNYLTSFLHKGDRQQNNTSVFSLHLTQIPYQAALSFCMKKTHFTVFLHPPYLFIFLYHKE